MFPDALATQRETDSQQVDKLKPNQVTTSGIMLGLKLHSQDVVQTSRASSSVFTFPPFDKLSAPYPFFVRLSGNRIEFSSLAFSPVSQFPPVDSVVHYRPLSSIFQPTIVPQSHQPGLNRAPP